MAAAAALIVLKPLAIGEPVLIAIAARTSETSWPVSLLWSPLT